MVEVDFYHAAALLPLSDEQLVDTALQTYLAGCIPEYRSCKVGWKL